MKKNYVMRFAAVLLVLVLLSTCVVSGTFAKYVTSGSAEDEARVAIWGVTVTVTGDDAFKTAYDGSVTSSTSEDVVAPGTSGDLATLSITGTPEVDVNIKYIATLDLGDNWKVGSEEYCPLVFHVKGTDYKIDGSTIKTVDELETAVVNAIATYEEDIEAGTDLSTKDDIAISWTWAFGTSDDVNDTVNKNDTALGNAAQDGAAPTINFSLTVTVTQVD